MISCCVVCLRGDSKAEFIVNSLKSCFISKRYRKKGDGLMNKYKRLLQISGLLLLAQSISYIMGHAMFEKIKHGANVFSSFASFEQSFDSSDVFGFLVGFLSSALVISILFVTGKFKGR